MRSFLSLFLAVVLGTALFKFSYQQNKGAESAEGDLERLETPRRRLTEIETESKLSRRQRQLNKNDHRRRAKKESKKGSSKGCPPGYTSSKGSKGACVANAPAGVVIAPLAPVTAPEAAPVIVPFTVPVADPASSPISAPVAVTINFSSVKGSSASEAGSKGGSKGSKKGSSNGSKGSTKGSSKGSTKGSSSKGAPAPVVTVPVATSSPVFIASTSAPVVAYYYQRAKGYSSSKYGGTYCSKGKSSSSSSKGKGSSKGKSSSKGKGSSKGECSDPISPVAAPPSSSSAPVAAPSSSSSAPVSTATTNNGSTAPVSTSSIYVEATAEDCIAISSGGLVQGQNGMHSTTFTFSFQLQLVNGVSNMATVVATAKAALQALVAQGIVHCGGAFYSSKGGKGKGGSRRLQKRRRVQNGTHKHHGRHHRHHRHHHHRNKQIRRLTLDPNVIGNVLFDVENCVVDTQNCPGVGTCMTCTGRADAFLKGEASDEDVATVISDYLHSPTFLTDSGLGQIASAFAATDAEHVDLPPTSGPTSGPTTSMPPSQSPSTTPSSVPSNSPTKTSSMVPTSAPSSMPSNSPSKTPSIAPSQSSAPSIAPSKPDVWNCFFNLDFEIGLVGMDGGYVGVDNVGGGADGSRSSLRLAGKRGVTSETSDSYDVSEYSRVRVSFAYRTRGLPGRDGWYLEYQANGGRWTTWERFVWDRYCFAHPLRWCSGAADLELTSEIDAIKFRFRTTRTRPSKIVYIDNVKFEAYGQSSSTVNEQCPTLTLAPSQSPSLAPSNGLSSAPSAAPWCRLFSDDFEDGLQFWTGGAVFVSRNGGGADDSLSSLRLIGRGGVTSESNGSYDVSEYSRVKVSFAYRSRGLPVRDEWYLEYQANGGEWTRWERFVWDRYCFAHPKRWCSGEADLELTNDIDTIKFRFRTLFVRGNPQIYIDNVKFEATGPSLTSDGECPELTSAASESASSAPSSAPSVLPSSAPSIRPSSAPSSAVLTSATSETASSAPSLAPSSAPRTAVWSCLWNEDFEDGLRFWRGGAVFVSRNGGGADGSLSSLRLIGRGGVTSETSDPYDVSEFDKVRVSFAYRSIGLPIRDGWYLEYQANGGEWTSWERFVWDRYCFAHPKRWCSGEADLELTNDIDTIKFRFRTLFVRGNPQIYIDNVKFESFGPSSSAADGECPTRTSAPSQTASSGPSLAPSSAPSTAPWNCLFNDNFENGLQFWTGGNAFVSRNGGGADDSLSSLRLIGRGGVTSESNDSYDVSEYSRAKISFAYRSRGLPIQDVWYLEYQANGGEWTSWERFVWDRYCFAHPKRWCSGEADLELTDDIDTIKFRFRTLFVRGNPQIYIDNVKFEATGPLVTADGECPT